MIHSEVEICKDGKVVLSGGTAKRIELLTKGLIIEKRTGNFPDEVEGHDTEDWECHLANHIHGLACLNDLATLVIAHFADHGITLKSYPNKDRDVLMPDPEFQGTTVKVLNDQAWLDARQKLDATDPEFFDKLMGHWVTKNGGGDANKVS